MADFTMFGKVGRSVAVLPDDDRDAVILAVAKYGLYGTEPCFGDDPHAMYLAAIFEALRDDVDNSINNRAKGSRGGRPSSRGDVKTTDAHMVKTTDAHMVKTTEREDAKPKPSQAKPIHTNPSQTKPGRDGAPATAPGDDDTEPFTPPTPEEVEAYARASTMPAFSAEEFVDHYSTVGWVMPNGRPVRDWHPLARSWARRQGEFDRRDAARRGEVSADGKPAWDPSGSTLVDDVIEL